MRNDTIFGMTRGGLVQVAADDVNLLEVRRVSIWRTIALGLFVIYPALVLVSGAELSDPP